MGLTGVSITKATPFRNSTQEFSNVYFYNLDIGHPNEDEANALIDAIAGIEKSFHASSVTFVRGRAWKQIGTPSQNEMITTRNLTGTGARTALSYDKERAFLFRIRAGNDSRGNPVYLRKWFHACGEFVSGAPVPSGVMDNTTSFTTAQRDAQRASVQPLRQVSVGASLYVLKSKAGRSFDAGAEFQAHQFLEHHQLGDQWRAQ
jgi:hypothetical protein